MDSRAVIDKLKAAVHNRTTIPLVVVATIAIAGSLVFVIPSNKDADSKNTVSASAPADECAAKNTVTFSCYKDELTNIVNKKGPEQAITLIKAQYPNVAYVKSQCHQLTHVVGRAAVTKYHDDLGTTYVHGNHFCASGYFHGASEQIVKEKGAQYMVDNANSVCAVFAKKARYQLDHYNCVHGLGHGFMEALDGNLFASLKACDDLTDSWEQSSCYSGVFMQNIMIAQSPDESADHSSKFLKTDDPMYPCNAVEERYKSGCYIIQTSWALPTLKYNYSVVFNLCAQVEETNLKDICYQSLGRDASGLQGYDMNKTLTTCLLGPDAEAQQNCAIGAAKDIVYNYHSDKQAFQFCKMLPVDIADVCTSTVVSYYATFN